MHTTETSPYLKAADLFQSLSHPVRLQILDELRRKEACVCHLQAVLDRPQAYISQQLRVLREAGIVQDRKEGQLVYYSIADQDVTTALRQVLGERGSEPTRPLNCPCPECSELGRQGPGNE